MVKTIALAAVLCIHSVNLLSQKPIENFNVELMAHVKIEADGNDCWGFVDEKGIEYAVIGSRVGTHIYSLENPRNPELRYTAYGARSVWRDIKYYKGFLYATADQDTFGLTIIDVRKAPDHISHTQWKPQIQIGNNSGTFLRAHNLYIDSSGFAYLAGHNISRRGVMIVDLKTDPLNPKFVSAADRFYSHDAYVQNNKLYSSELNNGFAVYDVSNKNMPEELGRARSSNNLTHNAWLSTDGKYLYTTDEVASGTVDSYDVEDPTSIRFLDKIKTQPETTRVIPHNTHVLNEYAITSWYTDGIVIKDISDPKQMTIVGAYDTYPQDSILPKTGQLFFGCWGAYPYLPSGLIIASDINNGLYILKPNYQKAPVIKGKVFQISEKGDTLPLELGVIRYLGTDRSKMFTSGNNEFSFKFSPGKKAEFSVSAPGFTSDTFTLNIRIDTQIIKNVYLKRDLVNSANQEHGDLSVEVFPNPAKESFSVGNLEGLKAEIYIYNVSGQLLLEEKEVGTHPVDISHLLAGEYFVQIISEKFQLIKKLVKN
jgi:choice-of-anchor B domain-containing protein